MNPFSKTNSEVLTERKKLFKDWRKNPIGKPTAFFAVLLSIYIISQFFLSGNESLRAFVNDCAQAVMTVAAFAVTWKLSTYEGLDVQTKRAWKIAALAYFSYACGQALWFYYRQYEGIEPFPSFTDFAYLAFYPLMLYAILSFPITKQTHARRRKFLLDTLTVMISCATVVWYFLIRPTIEKNTDILKGILNVAFLSGDVVLFLGILTILLRRPPKHISRSLFVLVASLICFCLAEISFAYITLHDIDNSGSLVILWVLTPFLWVFASFVQYQTASQTTENQVISEPEIYVPTFTWLPYVAIAVGYGVLLLSSREHWHEPLGAVVFAALALTGIVVLRQISAVKQNIELLAEKTARQSETRFRTLIENSSDIVMIFDLRAKVTYQSPSVGRILGYGKNSMLNRSGFSFIHPEDIEIIQDAYKVLAQDESKEVLRECRFQHKDGSWRVLEGIAKIIFDEESGFKGILLNARDINERKVLESKLKHQAFHDPLTNLANRTLFRSRVEEALLKDWDYKSEIAVLFLDLDDFKNINDTLGHDAGDKLLIEFTDKLKSCVRTKDTVARLGGDEFAVLLEGEDLEKSAVAVAGRILERVQHSFQVNNSSVKIGISIGIAFNDAESATADDLLRNADVAMYIAKSKGKNRFVIFESEMHRTLLEQLELENDLRQAVEDERLTINFQPIVNLKDRKINGVEALVRWNHPTRGFISPADFIPLAEQNGLIIPLGRQIMHKACYQIRNLFERTGRNLSVTINISAKQIQDHEFVKDLSTVLSETKIAPENVVLELTEGTMMENTEAMLKLLREIKSLGIRLAVDDFGTGYSSLSYLQKFPIDILKIDRSFVDGIENCSQKHAVARTIVSLSDTLGFAAVAEGIETAEQSKVLQEMGCEFAQGFYFARPMPLETLETLLEEEQTEQVSMQMVSTNTAELISKSIN